MPRCPFLRHDRHAGYSYSGQAAAWAYKSINTIGMSVHVVRVIVRLIGPTNLPLQLSKRVFILGPSHHFYLPGCALSKCTEYATPLGGLPLDRPSTPLSSVPSPVLRAFLQPSMN